MDLSKINSRNLRQVLNLLQKKEKLAAQLASVEAEIASIFGSSVSSAPAAAKAKKSRPGRKPKAAKAPAAAKTPKAAKAPKASGAKKGGSGKRGHLREAIISALQKAGSSGLSIKELSEKLKVKAANLHVWFSTTGKKVAEIQKVGEGRYAIQ